MNPDSTTGPAIAALDALLAEGDEETEPPAPYDQPLHSLDACAAGDPVFRIRPCDVGLGVFAARDIAAGEVILGIRGPTIDFSETKRRGPRECMAIQVGHDRYIDTQAPGVFVNHSCEPNAGIRNDDALVALRDIATGEEIRFDYSTTMEEQSFTMDCLCGAAQCRRVIRDFSTLPQHIQERYLDLGIVMSFIQVACKPRRHDTGLPAEETCALSVLCSPC